MMEDEIRASLMLNALTGVGPALYQALMKTFGSARKAFEAGADGWIQTGLVDGSWSERLKTGWEAARREAEKDWELLTKDAVQVMLWQEGPYPRLLRELSDAPPIIYVRGEDLAVDRPAIALVGSRRCSYYGEKTARRLAAELAEAGVTTVSGLARGIDTHVHRGTLDAGGKTWAVIGSGLAALYPPENKGLAQRIWESGAVISEFPMDTHPHPANFPRRNRIIAGLSLGTVVVEGGETSGALITARLAVEENRDVFAVPGPVGSPLSTAPHRLLRLGAKLVESAADILEEFSLEDRLRVRHGAEAASLEPAYIEVLSHVGAFPTPREILTGRLHKEAHEMSRLLLEMELKGLIRSLPGGLVVKA